MCKNRINLVYDSDFLAFLESSGMQFCLYLPKYEQIKAVIYIYHTISKYKI